MIKVQILGLISVPDIESGDNLGRIIVDCAQGEVGGIKEKDIVIITSKIVSKASGNIVALGEVRPGKKALAISKKTGTPASIIQLMMDNDQQIIAAIPLTGLAGKLLLKHSRNHDRARQLLEEEKSVLISRDRDGRISNQAGIDSSNHPDGVVSLLPPDPDRTAAVLRQDIKRLTARGVAVIIADSAPFFLGIGSIDLAIGSSGIEPITKRFAESDRFGKPKFGGVDITAHELTAAAALLFGQTDEGIPVVIIRGLDYQVSETENVVNTILPDPSELRKMIGSSIAATASIGNLKTVILSRILRWLLRV